MLRLLLADAAFVLKRSVGNAPAYDQPCGLTLMILEVQLFPTAGLDLAQPLPFNSLGRAASWAG